jgi:hypothetical protein
VRKTGGEGGGRRLGRSRNGSEGWADVVEVLCVIHLFSRRVML